MGLKYSQEYGVTKVARVHYKGVETKLIRLRNPWGCAEWSGHWGDQCNAEYITKIFIYHLV